MTEQQVSLSDPDELGLLIRCRQKMDKLKKSELKSYAQSVFGSLSMQSLKKLLFVGFNAIRDDIEYEDIFAMNTTMNAVIAKKKKKQKSKESKSKKESLPKVPKNASLSAVIPSDIMCNNICTFLTMSGLTNLARCDRELAIICHTPSSITNLMHRHDPYPYHVDKYYVRSLIDGHFYDWDTLNEHKMQNVQKLSVSIDILNFLDTLNSFNKVKNLSFYGFRSNDLEHTDSLNNLIPVPSLRSLSFVHFNELPNLLSFLQKYKNKNQAIKYEF